VTLAAQEWSGVTGRNADTTRHGRAEEDAAAQRAKRLRAKNLTLLVALLAFVVLVYFVSIVRMGGS
jgi:hypothetical protein